MTYMDTKEAAEYLGVSRQFLEKARSRGAGPAYHALTTRCIRYTRADLDAWVAERRRNSPRDDPQPAEVEG